MSIPLIVEARNKTKAECFRYLATELDKEKACMANEILAEDSKISTPDEVEVQLVDGRLTVVDFRLRPTQEES